MMRRTGRYNNWRDTDLPCTVVELPYKDDASMIIAMAEPGKIHELERGMSAETVQRWRTSWRKTTIELFVPKFNITSKINLVDELPKVGIRTPFTDDADFCGITPDLRLKVKTAVHQAVINVDEKGTVAAAATGIGMIAMSLTPSIHINNPFVFLIVEKKTNIVLFMGTVINPTEE
ncbi:alpha-1-antitrypsin homolog [Rana temporaria]|uniref:alpha-1-antitrypsin homolog n=1 Tax=Rana temporaria TaxID=8407 RepID=UPI001AADB6A6|nr:alpha-1-antitrypsin homolog [Rana temporaria]